MAVIDLMAYTRGAQSGQRDNWQDVLMDQRARSNEFGLETSMRNFALAQPLLEAQAAYSLEDVTGRRQAALDQAEINRTAMQLPTEQRANYIAEQLQALGSTNNNPAWQEAMNAYGVQVASGLRGSDVAGAQAVLAAAGPAGYAAAQQLGTFAGANSPEGVDASTVMYDGVQVPRRVALQAEALRARDPNSTAWRQLIDPYVQQARTEQLRQQQINDAQRIVDYVNSNGGQAFVNSLGQVSVLRAPGAELALGTPTGIPATTAAGTPAGMPATAAAGTPAGMPVVSGAPAQVPAALPSTASADALIQRLQSIAAPTEPFADRYADRIRGMTLNPATVATAQELPQLVASVDAAIQQIQQTQGPVTNTAELTGRLSQLQALRDLLTISAQENLQQASAGERSWRQLLFPSSSPSYQSQAVPALTRLLEETRALQATQAQQRLAPLRAIAGVN